MESKKQPLWLCFEMAAPSKGKYLTIFKDGDDLRQDQLTLQLIAFMDKVWRDEHLVDEELLVFTTFASTEAGMRRRQAVNMEGLAPEGVVDNRLGSVVEGDEGGVAEASTGTNFATTPLDNASDESSNEDEEEAAKERRDRERQRGDRESVGSSPSKGSTRILSRHLFGLSTASSNSESSTADANSPARPKRRYSRRMSQLPADESSSSKSGKSRWGEY